VALLGWNPASGNNQEIFSMTELERVFSLDNINKAGSVVNAERLQWINSRHIRALFTEERASDAAHKRRVVADVLPFITAVLDVQTVDGIPCAASSEADFVLAQFGADYVWKAMDLMKERVNTLPEFGPLCLPFFMAPDWNSADAQVMKAKYISDKTRE
jgi:glutamyl/glutaminyl-tRNA synthetase